MRFAWWWKIIKQYLRNCNIHGVKYLADDRLTKTERVFWLISCTLSWLGCVAAIYSSVFQYIENPVAVTIDTNFLDWQTPFPAVYLCISESPTMRQYYKRNPGPFGKDFKRKFLTATAEDLLSAYETLRIPCAELLLECKWRRMKFNCCEEFQEIRKTGVGYCLGMNTVHLKKNGKPNVHHFLNRTVKHGNLIVDINANATIWKYIYNGFSVHILSNSRLPILTDMKDNEIYLERGKRILIEFAIEQMYNEDGVRDVAIEHRNCRFYDEPMADSAFEFYSKNLCYQDGVLEYSMETCGCVNFYYYVPPWARVCNANESLCMVSRTQATIDWLLANASCLNNCDESTIIPNKQFLNFSTPNETAVRLQITAITHPLVRYRRYVTTSRLDVTVYVGSALGLFLGGSILSIFEVPYWLFIRRDKIK